MASLLLDTGSWDLVVDSAGNLAVCTEPYSLAQDAACFIRTFLGEVYYDTSQGVPYWEQILGKFPPLNLIKADLVAAAEQVPGVVAARVFISGLGPTRALQGQVQVTDNIGSVAWVNF